MYIYDEQDTFPRKISIKWSLLDNTKYDKWSSVNSETFLQKMFKTTKITFVFAIINLVYLTSEVVFTSRTCSFEVMRDRSLQT